MSIILVYIYTSTKVIQMVGHVTHHLYNGLPRSSPVSRKILKSGHSCV